MDKKHITAEIDQSAKTEVKISGELSAEAFTAYWPETLADLAKEVTIDGFRPGKAPEKLVVEKIGQDKILMEMANRAMQDIYPQLIKDHQIDAIGRPEVNINKLAKDNPLGFTVKTAIVPDFTLPDYQALAKQALKQEFKPEPVTERDIDMVTTELRRRLAASQNQDQKTDTKPTEDKENLPTLTDELAQTLGDFKTVTDLKAKITENLEAEKTKAAEDKKRQALIEAITTATDMAIPDILIESELDKMIGELRAQIESAGLKFDDYLTHLKKTEAELRSHWQADAEKRIKAGLLLQAIADKEKVAVTNEELTEMMNNLVPDLKTLDQTQIARLRSYATNLLTNDKVFALLETGK